MATDNCPNCGAVPKAGDAFCAKCGQALPVVPPTAKRHGMGWTFVGLGVLGVGVLLLLLFLGSMPASNASTNLTGTPTPPFVLSGLTTTWRLESAAYAGVAGGLWVPEVQFTIQNTQSRDIGPVYFRGRFSDGAATLEGDDITQTVQDVPAGYRRGPIFVDGGQGYTSDMAFLPMMQNANTRWRYQLSYATSFTGAYTLLQSGPVELPPNYRQPSGQ